MTSEETFREMFYDVFFAPFDEMLSELARQHLYNVYLPVVESCIQGLKQEERDIVLKFCNDFKDHIISQIASGSFIDLSKWKEAESVKDILEGIFDKLSEASDQFKKENYTKVYKEFLFKDSFEAKVFLRECDFKEVMWACRKRLVDIYHASSIEIANAMLSELFESEEREYFSQ